MCTTTTVLQNSTPFKIKYNILRHGRIQNKILCAVTDFYFFYYEPDLENLGKAPRACPPFFSSTKETVYTCV